MRALAFALGLLIAAPALAAEGDVQETQGLRFTPYGEAMTAELTNIISLQSVFGTSTQRDIETTTNTGAIGLDTGYIELTTGTTTGSDARLETVDRGQYQPGKGAESGMGVRLVTVPDSGTEAASWGLGDGDNGIFWRYHDADSDGDFELCVIYERAETEDETCEGSFNKQGLGSFDVTTGGAIYIVRFNWYGFGGADFLLLQPGDSGVTGLVPRLVHRHVPAAGQALEDPNLPIFAEVDNGNGTTNVELEVGGRRYDIQGKFRPPLRKTHARRTGVSVGTSYTPIICVRKEDPFPESGRQNSVNAFFASFTPTVETEDITVVYAKVELADLTDANFVDPPDYDDGNTALEYDISSTAVSDFIILQGGFTFEAGGGGFFADPAKLGEDKTERVDIIRNTPTCALAKTDANTATVDATLRVTEEW
jgi:hypothetical protein